MLQEFLDRMPTKGGAGGTDKMSAKRKGRDARDQEREGSVGSLGRDSMSHGGYDLN